MGQSLAESRRCVIQAGILLVAIGGRGGGLGVKGRSGRATFPGRGGDGSEGGGGGEGTVGVARVVEIEAGCGHR